MKGCAMFACGVESATNVHPPLRRWRRDTKEDVPSAASVALTSDRQRILVHAVKSQCTLARAGKVTASGRCMEPMRRCRTGDRERQRSVRSPGEAPPAPKRRGGSASQPYKSAFASPRRQHGERGASERIARSECLRKQHSLLTSNRANGWEWLTETGRRAQRCPAAPQAQLGGS